MTTINITGRVVHALAIARKWPGAELSCKPQGGNTVVEWVDGGAVPAKTEAEIKTAQDEYEASPTGKATVISYEAFQGRFTAAEFNAATDFVYENDPLTNKPKRRALIQGISRVLAKGMVGLLDSRTAAFMDALVAGGIIDAARKTEILMP